MRLFVKISARLAACLILALPCAALCRAAVHRTDVTVKVVDKKTAQTIPGVVVGFPAYEIWGVSDNDGRSLLKDVPHGKAKLSSRMVGMVTWEKEIEVSESCGTIIIEMEESSFRLDEVVVVARSNVAGASTSSSISRAAIDHLQATSLSDVMELLPGQLAGNPSLSSASKATIRQANSDALNSMGTSIIVNGAPVSNNANLQVGNTATDGTLNPGFSSTAGSGVDLRSISVDNVESVDVIRGIPSVEYGDLTSGVIIVNPKAGEFPFQLRLKVNPTLTQASLGKGFRLGRKGGTLSADFDYASSLADERRPYQQYRRITTNLLYSKTFNETVRTTTGAGFYFDADAQKLDPSDKKYRRRRSAENIGFKFNTNISWQANRGFLKSLKFNISTSYSQQKGYTQELKGNFGYMVTSAMQDGTVASNVSSPVTDIYGNPITNTHLPGYSAATNILPYEFLTKMTTYGEPLNVFAKGLANMYTEFWGIGNKIIAGADWKLDVNFGRGKVFDPLMPPSGGLRMRPYTDIPALNQFALFAEDNISRTILKRELKIQVGLRFDMIQPGRKEGGNILSPRINASYEILPSMLTVRGGWGITAKAPPMVFLYPDKAYFDFVNYSNIGGKDVSEEQTLSIITTKVYDTSNKLKIAHNMKSELGLDFQFKDMRFSVTGYREKLTDGYSFGLDRNSFRIFELKKYKGTEREGTFPALSHDKSTMVVLSYKRPLNDKTNDTKGIEFDMDFGQIRAIRTSFVLTGAYMKTDIYSTANSYYQKNPDANTGKYKDIGVYGTGDGSRYTRFSTNLRVIHNIPKIGFVVSLSVQTIWHDSHEYLGLDNVKPIAYISAENLRYIPINEGDEINPDIQKQILENRRIKESHPILACCNLRITKEIGNFLGFTFFLNNMFKTNPLEESRRNPGSYSSSRNPEQFFGIEAWIKF